VKSGDRLTGVSLAGEFSQEAPIDRSAAGEKVLLPRSSIDAGELVFRVRSSLPNFEIEAGDLLIFQPRDANDAANGELVIAIAGGRAFVGHWRKKRGTRALLDRSFGVITAEKTMQVLGAITLIVRPSS
jgi:SOS-response transcriptional repressor LexA